MLIRLGSLSQHSRQERSPCGGKLSGELPGNRAVGGRRPQSGGDGGKKWRFTVIFHSISPLTGSLWEGTVLADCLWRDGAR